MKNKKSKWVKTGISLVIVAALVGATVIIMQNQSSNAVFAQDQQMQTMTLAKTDITKTVSVSGVVESAQSKSIYSTQSYPVKEIYVKVGDTVKAGDLLAELDMSKLLNDIAQTEINLQSAITATEEEKRTNNNSTVNAQTSLEAAQITVSRQQLSTSNAEKDLREAEAKVSEEFNSYTYDNTIEDARISLERKTEDLEKARLDLEKAVNAFDDYSYQNTIKEAKITLERKKVDLEDAETKRDDEENNTAKAFDDYTWQNAITDAEMNYNRKLEDYNTAQNDCYNAWNDYYNTASIPEVSNEAVSAAWSKVENAQKAMDSAGRAVDDAYNAWEKAKTDLKRAKDDYNEKNADSKDDSVSSAQKAVDNAQNAVNDAQRSYDRAVTDLDRARKDAVTNATDKLTTAQNAYNDAVRSYEKALSDKTRAIETYMEDNETKLTTAQKTYEDSQKQLESSQNSLRSARNTLNQAQSKPATSDTNVQIQELNLEKLNEQLTEGKIVATADGVITEVNTKIGATPNGVLFVIEDTQNLYVSAHVKEYNLSSVSLGQKAAVTTDATGDSVYTAEVSYISPKAVSTAGSTSVEFEVRADLHSPDTAVKIGMNAFLSITTASETDVFAVPLSMIVTNEKGSFVYAMENGEKKEIPVTLGIQTSTNAGISGDGLYDGIKLLTNPENGGE